MTQIEFALQYRQLRAPQAHAGVLVDPPPTSLADLIERNCSRQRYPHVDCQGRSLARLATSAQNLLIDQAYRYTRTYSDVAPQSAPASLIFLAGHQPELFHPGVWFKNVALSKLAEQYGAVSVNLLIDNDPVRQTSIQVPTGTLDDPRVVHVEFDRAEGETPYEERPVWDTELFSSFASRVQKTLSPLVTKPLVHEIWPDAIAAAREGHNLGQSIARGRHRWEREHGLSTLELPLSTVCASEPFYWFLAHLLAQAPRFYRLYNDSLDEYRRVNRIRSRSHPATRLIRDADAYEVPFWIWNTADPTRRRLFVRIRGNQLELDDRANFQVLIPLSDELTADRTVTQLADLAQQDVKIRPRALLTTMYARMFLGDLFLHGIGGAKYDQLTDQLIHQFWGIDPPGYLTTSATALLPVKRPEVAVNDLRRVENLLRKLRYHPEHHLDLDDRSSAQNEETAARWVASKQQWLDTQLPRGQRKQRHLAICQANEALQTFVAAKRQLLEKEHEQLAGQLRKNLILGSREYAFCLFSEDFLWPLLLDLLGQST